MISLSKIIFSEGMKWKNRVDQYLGQPNTYVHFSNLPKLGVNPKSEFRTPIGIYAYPFKQEKMSPFAQDRKYMIIFKAKNPERVLNSSNYSGDQYDIDLEKLRQKYGIETVNPLYVASTIKARRKTFAGMLWYMTWNLSDGNIILWNKIWKEVLGYDGFSDEENCLGVIHNSEPCQSVFWRLNDLEVLDIIENPASTNSYFKFQNNYDTEQYDLNSKLLTVEDVLENLKNQDKENPNLTKRFDVNLNVLWKAYQVSDNKRRILRSIEYDAYRIESKINLNLIKKIDDAEFLIYLMIKKTRYDTIDRDLFLTFFEQIFSKDSYTGEELILIRRHQRSLFNGTGYNFFKKEDFAWLIKFGLKHKENKVFIGVFEKIVGNIRFSHEEIIEPYKAQIKEIVGNN